MAHVVDRKQLGIRDLARERGAVRVREQRVVGAVDDERGHADLGQPLPPAAAAFEVVVVGEHRLWVARAVERACPQRARAVGVERPGGAGVRAAELSEVIEQRGPVVEVRDRNRERAGEAAVDAREVVVAGPAAGGDQRQALHAVGMVERDHLRKGSAHRDADDVGTAAGDRLDDRGRVGDQVIAAVAGLARLVRHRLTGVAMVVADHEPSRRGEPVAELVLPPVERGARAVDEQDRRVGGVAERFDAEVDSLIFMLCGPLRLGSHRWRRRKLRLGGEVAGGRRRGDLPSFWGSIRSKTTKRAFSRAAAGTPAALPSRSWPVQPPDAGAAPRSARSGRRCPRPARRPGRRRARG